MRRHRRWLRFSGPALLVGQEFGKLVEELDVRPGPLNAVAGPSGIVEAHRLGPRLDVFLERGELPRIGKCQGIVAAHVGADGAIEEVPRQVVCQRHIGNIIFVLIKKRLRVCGLDLRVARAASCGPDCLREVGPAQTEEQADLDREEARRRDSGFFVVRPEAGEPGVIHIVAGCAGGAGHLVNDFHVGGRVGRLADRDERIDQAAPGDSESRFRAGGRRQDPATRLDHAAIAVPHIADADLDRAVIAAARIRQPLVEERGRGIQKERGQGGRRGLPGLTLPGRVGDRRSFEARCWAMLGALAQRHCRCA